MSVVDQAAGSTTATSTPRAPISGHLGRAQQELLALLGGYAAAAALVGAARPCASGRLAVRDCWVDYSPNCLRLESWPLGTRDPVTLATVRWRDVAAHGKTLPAQLRADLLTKVADHVAATEAWRQFSSAHGHYPWRDRYASNEEYASARAHWEARWCSYVDASKQLQRELSELVELSLPLAYAGVSGELPTRGQTSGRSPLPPLPPLPRLPRGVGV